LEVIESMSWHLLKWASTASGGLGFLGLFASVAIAQNPPLFVPAINGFLDWLRHPDTGEPPRGPRPGDGRFCVVNFVANVENLVWSDRPAFIVQGSPRSLAVYRDTAQDPIWEYPVNEAEVVVYTGPPLEPDTVYTLRARHSQFPSSIYEQRQLRTMSFDNEVQTTGNLLALEGEMRNGESVTEADIAIAKADYFWQQGLETDAWAAIWALRTESSEVAGALQMGYEKLCGVPSE
jgi:hypothetical protein